MDGFTPNPKADSYLDSINPPQTEYTRHVFQCWDDALDVANECGKLGWRVIHIHDAARVINVIFERNIINAKIGVG